MNIALPPEIFIPALGAIALKLIVLLFVLFIVLFTHELGHFFAARFFGIKVGNVEIGTGRSLASRLDRRGTRWTLKLIPFGAHVGLTGLESRPYWQRAITIAAGPLINLTFPFLLLLGFYLIVGQPSIPPVIVGVQQDLPADKAGLQPGDKILAVNGVPVHIYRDLWREAYENGITDNRFTILRRTHTMDIIVKPEWIRYIDDGVDRANPRYGLLYDHVPLKYTALLGVNDFNVENNPAAAREVIRRSMDRLSLLNIKGPGDEPSLYKVILRSAANADIDDKTSKNYNAFFVGPTRYNVYVRQDYPARISGAVSYYFERMKKVIAVPFQIFPIDPYAIRDDNAVWNPDTKIANWIYDFIHNVMVVSFVIGFINLLPLPYLDGGHILMQGIESVRGRPLPRRAQAFVFVVAFLIVYMSVLFVNTSKIPRYIDSRLKKVHEFMSQKNHEPENHEE